MDQGKRRLSDLILVRAPSAHAALQGHERRYGLIVEGSRNLVIVR